MVTLAAVAAKLLQRWLLVVLVGAQAALTVRVLWPLGATDGCYATQACAPRQFDPSVTSGDRIIVPVLGAALVGGGAALAATWLLAARRSADESASADRGRVDATPGSLP
jgi:hypothetical protein